jgi:uncharacterized protein YjiK
MKAITRLTAALLIILLTPGIKLAAQSFSKSIDIVEASAITGLSSGSFIVVDDERGIFYLNPNLEAELLLAAEQHSFLNDLEGVALSPDKKQIYFLSEKGGSISLAEISDSSGKIVLGTPQIIGNLPQIGEEPNKGWEGICTTVLDNRSILLAAHQEKPKAIAMFELPSLKLISMCKLPEELKNLLKNLSDICVDYRTGHILLLSGKSARVVEIKAKISDQIDEIDIISITNLKGNLSGRPEGLCFDSNERLVVVTDGAGEPGTFIRLNTKK